MLQGMLRLPKILQVQEARFKAAKEEKVKEAPQLIVKMEILEHQYQLKDRLQLLATPKLMAKIIFLNRKQYQLKVKLKQVQSP